ncbi:MAG TPA: 16S rRNA (adenine(1518)-N(6)/adenine(1519)-N(6))-dimethyltransferase RsmA [Thermoanaerobaculia bacterium]|nr:16S rRNA (adenine(1518)-N(6)/adenine(1519)-N(6))-dimethyltransferase RsmA [Thermoanaerobaculia bacterium]
MAHKPQKRWGQNFLRNASAVDKIVAALEPSPGELLLEIGPGRGALTRRLAELPNEIVAWEIDPELASSLRTELGDRVRIEETDATDAPLPDAPFRVVGNLPYNVATPIVRRVVASSSWRRAVFMFQKEVADKLTARPGDDDFGFLTLAVALRAQARKLMTLGPGSFYPRPKVDSAVVVLDPVRRDLVSPIEEIESIVSTSFRMRRKTLVNNLVLGLEMNRQDAVGVLEECGIEAAARAETLDLATFDRLATVIAARRADGRARTTPRP